MPSEKLISIKELSSLTGKTPQTIRNWIKQGCPTEDGKFSVPVFFTWYTKYVQLKAKTKSNPAQAKLNRVRAKQIEMKIKKETQNLLPRKETIAGIIARIQRLTSQYNTLSALALKVSGKSPSQTQTILENWFKDELVVCLTESYKELHLSSRAERKLKELFNIIDKEMISL